MNGTDGTEMRQVDVLVAGAGPAGCSAARAAAEAGASVLLVDAKREAGLPVRCAEFVPRLMAREVEIPADAVAQAVDEMVVSVEGTEIGRVRSPGFILHRERFERNLAKLAVAAGADLLMETRATPSADGAVVLTGQKDVLRIRPKVVVSGEGPFSAFRSGEQATRCLPAVQFTVPLARPMSNTEVHFARGFRLGYAWLFPKGEVANVGVGCAPPGGRKEILPLLEAFVEHLRREGKLAGGESVRRTAGWIPVWGPPESAVDGSVLFAGDAGGFADPLTGAGIRPAIVTGGFAGRRAAKAAGEGDVSVLSTYDDDWRELLGPALTRSAAARRRLDSEWDSRELAELVREVWPGLRRKGR